MRSKQATTSKRRWTAVIATAATIAALGACGGDDGATNPTRPARTDGGDGGAGEVAWPAGSDDVVLRLGDGPIPQLLVAGDGRAYSPSTAAPRRGPPAGFLSIAPAPAAPAPMIVRQLTPEGMELLFARADELGLLDPAPEYADVEVTDALFTHLLLRDDDGTYEHAAYALGYADETDDERAAFADMVDDLRDLPGLVGADNVGDAEPYVPATYSVSVVRATTSDGQRWPDAVPLATGCVDLPIERFPEGVAGSYLHGTGERVWVVPDLPGDGC